MKDYVADAPVEQPKQLGAVNEWLVHTLDKTFKKYQEYFEKHEFGLALQVLEKFFWNNFCDNYLEMVKNQMFKPEDYKPETIAATKWTLHHVGLRLLQLFGPYLPHVTETIYEQVFGKEGSLHATQFADIQVQHNFPESINVTETLINIIGAVRRFKTEKQLSLKVALTDLTVHSVNPELLKMLVPHEQMLKGIAHAHTIVYASGTIEKSGLTQHDENWSAHIDLDHITDAK